MKLNPLGSIFGTDTQNPYSIERAAKMYRNAACMFLYYYLKLFLHFFKCMSSSIIFKHLLAICEATCTWSGQLPPRMYKNPTYSCKVFLGGVPWDITESESICSRNQNIGNNFKISNILITYLLSCLFCLAGLQNAFKSFGPMKIEWPGKDGKHPRYLPRGNITYVKGVTYCLWNEIYSL